MKLLKKGIILLLVSVLLLTGVYASNIIIQDKGKDVQAEDDAKLIEEYSKKYGDNVNVGAHLYVWSGDKAFSPKEYLPDGMLSENETIEYHDGVIDFTPGATSVVVYRVSAEKYSVYKLYLFTAVLKKESATVRSEKINDVIYGLSKSEGFTGYVPSDYTECGKMYESDRELTVQKGSVCYPEFAHWNYNSNDFVLSIKGGNVNTAKNGTYTLTYEVTPVSDASMNWYEKYTIHVTDAESENKGMKVTVADSVIHATVTDNNGNDSEVYLGREFNLDAGVRTIEVQNLRGYDAYADIEILKNGKVVDKNDFVLSEKEQDGSYIITFKNSYDYRGMEVKLANRKVAESLMNKSDNVCNGGWDNNENAGIEVDDYDETQGKTFADAIISNITDSFVTVVKADSEVKQKNIKKMVSDLKWNHSADEYHKGVPTGRKIYDGVRVYFSKSKLTEALKELAESKGLSLVSKSDVPGYLNIYCIDHGVAGYKSNQLSLSLLDYVTAYLMKDKKGGYYIHICAMFHSKGRQRIGGKAVNIKLEEQSAYLKIFKKTKVKGENVGVVKGAVYGVYAKKADAEAKKRELFKLTLDGKGEAITSEKQAKKLSPGKKYYVRELSNPMGTDLNDKIYKIETTTNNTGAKKAVKLNVENIPWDFSIQIHKVEKNTGKNLSGAKFEVKEWNGKEYKIKKDVGNNGILVTDYHGDASTGKLYYTKTNQGKFRITEIEAPPEHINNHATKDYQITKKNAASIEPLFWKVENGEENPKGYISIQKMAVDSENKNVSKALDLTATFNIYSDKECKNIYTKIITNKSGYGKLTEAIPTGTYYIKEISWANGTTPFDKDYTKGIKVEKNKTTVIKANPNTETLGLQKQWGAGLQAVKKDSVTGKPLGGAEFTFYEWNGASYIPIAKRISDKTTGIAKIDIKENLVKWTTTNQGRFAVAETKAPDDYEIDDKLMKEVVITVSNENNLIKFETFKNTPGGFVDFTKVIVDVLGNINLNYDFSSRALRITYGIYYDAACTYAVSGYDNIVLDGNGHFKSRCLRPGTYYLKEKTLNTSFFVNKPGAVVEFMILPGKVTYLCGDKGISYADGIWDNSIW